ncbi:ABC transporter ATP-binding protein [Microbacterium sp. 18062]|uniref:ABC transporter ATP-binding protein n=1 Tax=Microbacterium sp. 18062 TaxID=2681410 RepID=UPI0013583C5C|nr:ABC transporter ATP-binding protein [Microbacterium sp. 18062]
MPDRSTIPLLDVSGVTVDYGHGPARTRVLHGVDLTVQPGEVVGLIGESGSGKTTLARAILGLVPLTRGEVRFDGAQISDLGGRRRRAFRRSGALQYVFQDPLLSLDPDLPAGASVAEGLRVRGGLAPATIAERVTEAFIAVGLDPGLADRRPAALSGGQRQRVVVARALVLEPKLVLLDEPVSALDSANRIQILRLLDGLGATRSIAQVFISHDLGSVAGIAGRVVVLYRGRVVEDGPTERVLNRPQHPYTKLLVGSAPTLTAGAATREDRRALREALAAHTDAEAAQP